jgi:3'-5' exoribonuclease
MIYDPIEYLRKMAVEHHCADIAFVVLSNPKFARWSGSSEPNKHHYGDGGLAQHTYEVAVLCFQVAEGLEQIYGMPSGREIYLAALYHDLGKLWDYEPHGPSMTGPAGWQAVPHKRLIHHISRSAIEWSRAVDKYPAYRDIEDSVLHAILAHHGRREWGSPVAPKSRLAWLLHYCDAISARFSDADSLDVVNRA